MDNLTPRQLERKRRAEERKRKQKRNAILFITALVLIAVAACVAIIVKLVSPAPPQETTPASSQTPSDIRIPEQVNTDTEPQDTEPQDTQPEDTQPEDTQPEDTQPAERKPQETKPEETKPQETEPSVPAASEPEDAFYFFPDSDSRYLSYEDYKDLSTWELVLARNEIFARHGRRFDDKDIQAYFDGCSWYKGTVSPKSFDSSVFNDYELKNIQTLKSASDARRG